MPSRPRVSYFGPAFTNTHAAARSVFGESADYVPESTKTAVFDAVASGSSDRGVVPIENSTEGVVRETVDCLISMSPVIERELEMDIRHCLMGRADTDPKSPTVILSHPQPLAQCRKWLDAHYPHVPRETAMSTAGAAAVAKETPGCLAIASRLAAEAHALTIFEDNIADRLDNATRFLVIGRNPAPPSGKDKTSLVFSAPHERGALLGILRVFDEANVNLTRIESRPLPTKKWEYAFVVDVIGHQDQAPLKDALMVLSAQGSLIKVMGSFPRQEDPAPQQPAPQQPAPQQKETIPQG